MEHDYDLLKVKAGDKKQSGKLRRRSMRRFMAMLLSVVLAAGTCLPAMAVEQPEAQAEEAGGAAYTDSLQAAEVQPEESEEASEAVSTEETGPEDAGSSAEEDDQAADPVQDSPENTEDADAAGTAMTDDAAEIAAVEELEGEVEPEETTLSDTAKEGALLNSEGDSAWLNDYDYSISELEDGTEAVLLNYYLGADTEIVVPGTAQVEGVTYPVTAEDGNIWEDGTVESFTFGPGFIFPSYCSGFFSGKQSLIAVDLSQADTSRVTDMSSIFSGCSNLQEVNLGSIDVSDVTDVSSMFAYCSSVEELDLSCFSGTGTVQYISYIFDGCSSLRRLDLGGWNWSLTDESEIFYETNNLEELITPAYVPYGTMSLPYMMADQDGNLYKYMPVGTDSVTLTKAEPPEWLNDYSYSMSEDGNAVVLDTYNGSDSVITVPESVTIAGKEYQVKFQGTPWMSGVTSLTFEGSDPFYGYIWSNTFEMMQDLEVLDLSSVNCTWDNQQSLGGCAHLKTLYLPANCQWGSALPGLFKDEEGNYYTEIPWGLVNSKRLDAVECSEWLEDFSYDIWNGVFELTGYYGNQADLVIPGTAEVDGKQYNEIQIRQHIWTKNRPGSGIQSLKLENGVSLGYNGPNGYEMSGLFDNEFAMESFDGSELGGIKVLYANYLFSACSNLKTVDLRGFDFSECYGAEDFFTGCNNLETIVVPANVNCSIKLPGAFSDEDGNLYTEIPRNLNESVTLIKAEASEWLADYNYDITDDSVVLLKYNKQPEWEYDDETGEYIYTASATVQGSAVVGTKEYNRIVLSDGVWDASGVRELYFEDGVYFPEDCSGLFSCEDLEKIDLSEVNLTGVAEMQSMFKGCGKLSTIVVPKNVTLDAYLTGVFTDGNGNTYTSLPKNMSESFTITAVSRDERLADFDYHIAGDKVVLTGYHGEANDLVIPGSAVFGDTTFTKVEITPEIDWEGAAYSVEHLSFENGVVLPEDCSEMFYSYRLQSIDLSNVDTSHVTNMSNMFECYNLTDLDVSGFNTSNVTDMSKMFSGCSSLTELDVSGFDTSNVTNMYEMFAFCNCLAELDVSGFDTSKVTNMENMFLDCYNLTELDVSGFDTSNVTNMDRMFSQCSELTSLDVSGFDTSNVISMEMMFYSCAYLTSLDVSGFDTSKVETMYSMFSDCENLTSLDVSGFDTSNVTNMSFMFYYCKNLPVLDVSGFNTEKVKNISGMFRECNALLELDLSRWNLASVQNARSVFSGKTPVINAPASVPVKIGLSAIYTGSDGNTYDSLPLNAGESILLTWTSESGDPGGDPSGDPSESGDPVVEFRIVRQPSDVTVLAGEEAVISLEAMGVDVTSQWQYSADNGENWTDLEEETSAVLRITADEDLDGYYYRCILTSGDDTIISDAAKLTVNVLPEIIEQPQDVSGSYGEKAYFRVTAQGGESLSYKWEYSKDNGETWKTWTGKTEPEAAATISTANDGFLYRCKVSNEAGTVVSAAARLTLVSGPVITQQPQDAYGMYGQEVTFTVAAESAGDETLSYKWEYSKNGGETWKTWSGKTEATASVNVGSGNNGIMYRCIVSNSYGSVTSEAVTLHRHDGPVITSQPADVTGHAGEQAVFSIAAESPDGDTLSYQWYFSTDNGETWRKWKNKTEATAAATIGTANDGCLYRCIVSDSMTSVTSEAAMLTLSTSSGPVITSQPADVTGHAGEQAVFSIGAESPDGKTLSYQWYFSTDNGETWRKWKGKTEAEASAKIGTANDGCLYRCIVSDGTMSVTSDEAMLILAKGPVITSQPSDVSGHAGEQAVFSIGAESPDGKTLSYQWQYSNDNGETWRKWKGKTEAEASAKIGTANDGCLYRCIVSDGTETVTSDEAMLTLIK